MQWAAVRDLWVLVLAHVRFGLALLAVAAVPLTVIVLVVIGLVDDARCRQRWPRSRSQHSESWSKRCVIDPAPLVQGLLP